MDVGTVIERPKSASGVSLRFDDSQRGQPSSSPDSYKIGVKPSTSPSKILIAVAVGTVAVVIVASVVIPVAIIYGSSDNHERKQEQDMGTTTDSTSTSQSLTDTTGSGSAATTPMATLSTTRSSKETTSASGSTSTQATLVGNFTEWGSWTTCTATCGSGTYTRYRQCISPNGETCTGDRIQLDICQAETCPVYGKWSTWSGWGSCDKSCGNGSQTRTRVCNKTNDISDLDCVGDVSQSQQCSTWTCPDCSQSCDVGYLNDECDTCICDSTVISGRVIADSTGFGIGDVNVFAASAPTRLLTSSNSTGFFSLMTMCTTSKLFISREGFLDQTAEVTETDLTLTMTYTVQPRFTKTPQSKNRLSGENVTLCCEAEGVPDIAYYEWFKDGIILDEALYPERVSLHLEDVRTTSSGVYKCRANSLVGTKMSSDAELQVKDLPDDFCADALVRRTLNLPSDCIQPSTNTATYEIGECISKQCRRNGSFDDNYCREDVSSCCTAGQTQLKTVQCSGYSLDIFVVISCTCADCKSGSIKVSGTVTGIDTTSPLVFGEVWVNGYLETYTSISGSYSLHVPKQTNEIVLAFVDTYYRQFLPTTKVIQISDEMSGTIQVDVTLIKSTAPIEISSTEENILSVSSVSGNSSMGASFSIPANSFCYPNGTKYEGTVSSTITFLDPSNPFDGTYLPANFEFIDQEGETGSLASLGVFNFLFQDSDGNDLSLDTSVEVSLPEDIAASVSNDDFKLWILNQSTGKWELLRFSTSGGNTKRSAVNVIGSIDPSQISRYRWYNIDKIDRQERCSIKLRVFKGAMLTDEITNFNRYIYFRQHWLDGYTFSTFSVWYYRYQQNLCGTAACNNLYGFITASQYGYSWRGRTYLFPGNVSEQFTMLSYEIDGQSSRVNFSRTSNGPFFNDRQACFASDPTTSLYVPFHYGIEVYQFTSNEYFDFSPPPTDDKMSLSDRTWYVNRVEGYRVCFMKIRLEFHSSFYLLNGEAMKLRLTSKGGTVNSILGVTFGIREIEITNTSDYSTWCAEYKCSGTISPQLVLNPLIDNTNVVVEIKGINYTNCTVSSESPNLAASQSQIGNSVVSFNAPVVPTPNDDGMYFAPTDQGKDSVQNKREQVEKECKSGKGQIWNEDNPDIGLAFTMYCKRCRNCP